MPTDPPAQSLWSKLGPTGILAIVWAAFPAVCGGLLLVYAKSVSDWLHAQGMPASVLIYAGGFILLAGLGLLPTYAQSALAGWCFLFATGLPIALAGFVGASLVGYVVARGVSRGRVEELVRTNPKARAVQEVLIGHGPARTLGTVILLRLPPNSPFALMNLAMSSTGVPIGPYLLGTAIGMAPRTAAAVYIGSSVQTLTKKSLDEAVPLWAKIGMIAVTVVILGAIGLIANHAIARVSGPKASPADGVTSE